MTDTLQRFVFDNLDARGAIVQLESSCEAIQATHYYPQGLAVLLNEFSAAACLLRDSLKAFASVTIQLRGSGAISLIMADCLTDRRVRAIAEYDSEALPSEQRIDLQALSSDMVLAITITPDEGERYQGVVPIEHSSLEQCLEDYFSRSEQLPTWFSLLASRDKAVGISIHALPAEKETSVEASQDNFARLQMLLKTLTHEEALALDSETILTRLFAEESCRVFAAKSVEFGCECSVEKSLNAVASLGAAEVAELIAEQRSEGKAQLTIDCHFCFQRYEFDLSQIESMLAEAVEGPLS